MWFQVMVVSHGFQIGFETAYPNDDGRIDSTGPAHVDCYTRGVGKRLYEIARNYSEPRRISGERSEPNP